MKRHFKQTRELNPAILLHPLVMGGKFYKGIIWVCFPDILVKRYPDVKKYFIIVSSTGWYGWSPSSIEDLHAITVQSEAEGFKKMFPDREYIILRNSHFISEDDFYPLDVKKEYDIIFPAGKYF